jgi:hypothetical protein
LELRNERVYEAEMHRIRDELFRSMASVLDSSNRQGQAASLKPVG